MRWYHQKHEGVHPMQADQGWQSDSSIPKVEQEDHMVIQTLARMLKRDIRVVTSEKSKTDAG